MKRASFSISGLEERLQRERTHLDLFSGIGGFALAAQWAGFRTVAFCERDEFCQAVLRKHWPGVPQFADICKFDGAQFRGVDLLTSGFPCQPYSFAGKQLGSADGRALWPEMLRVIKESRPRWIVGENVAGIINLELDRCLSDLEAAGYTVQAFIIPACAVDAKHRRDRVWIVGHSERAERRSHRIKSLGNAIVPQVAFEIIKAISQIEE